MDANDIVREANKAQSFGANFSCIASDGESTRQEMPAMVHIVGYMKSRFSIMFCIVRLWALPFLKILFRFQSFLHALLLVVNFLSSWEPHFKHILYHQNSSLAFVLFCFEAFLGVLCFSSWFGIIRLRYFSSSRAALYILCLVA